MEQRTFFLKMAIVLALALLWMNLAPWLFPQLFPQQNVPVKPPAVAEQEQPEGDGDPAAIAEKDRDGDAEAAVNAAPEGEDSPPAPDTEQLVEHPQETIELGSLDPQSNYYALVTLTSTGAAIESVQLNDPRFTAIEDRHRPLKIVGNDSNSELKTLQTSVKQIDAQLKTFGTSLGEVDWEVVAGKRAENEVAFRYRAPDGSLEVRKTYRLNQGDPTARDTNPEGYLVDFDFEVQNLTAEPQEIMYALQGPVGLPLEDQDNSRTYIELKAGTLEDPGAPDSVSDVTQTAAEVVDQVEEELAGDPTAIETWRSPFEYVGVDVQYFAALIFPQGNQVESRYFSEARPVLVSKQPKNDAWSDVSVLLTSQTEQVEPTEALEHNFRVFFGPKRSELLEPLNARGVQNFGWFAIVSRGMLSVLHFFHDTLLAPYGLAIIMLTVVVRACMFPISRKMAINQQRMKELQPKMQEIRNKYKDDQEKMAQAYREFMAKNGFNPLAGCLPMFLQLPIFIGLYQALYNSVDLRMARFLWVDNLAAPDQLFAFGFTLPIVGWTHFNLLPLITVVLFVAQQKMFMPPPTSEEQEMQYKMMNFFTIFIGFMFYRVPAGLCVYFIASSLWGIAERKLLVLTGATSTDTPADAAAPPDDDQDSGRTRKPGRKKGGGEGVARSEPKPEPAEPAKPGLLQRLVAAADEAKNPTNGTQTKRDQKRVEKRKGQGRKAKPRR